MEEPEVVGGGAANRVFTDASSVTVIHGGAGELFDRGPFDQLVHDGGWRAGKAGHETVRPVRS